MLRPLLHYFLIGGLLFAAKSMYDGARQEGPVLTVRVAPDATGAEVERQIREAILLHEARRYGWDRSDPVVFTHLVRNMRFIEPSSTETDLELYKRAIEMNMQAHDPVIRARLLYRANEALGFVPEDRMPTREELDEHRREHRDRFERESKIRFAHVFLSGSKRGDTLSADASAMRDRLSGLGKAPAKGLGDPLPGLRPEQVATASKLRSEYGAELASIAEEGLVGSWRGPVSSVYGLHFIKVIENEPAYVPPLDVIGAEVRADWLSELREQLRAERMETLRDAYTVHVERAP